MGLINQEKKRIEAVKNISFSIDSGETVAFIGPNGAGKSTTIKMLTGILFPTAGQATVAGFCPWESRQRLAYEIGAVFGQRSQLSYHLPARDSFRLFSKLYELEKDDFTKNLNRLTELFEIGDLLDQPLRKLSLGQRMRCEVVASLLHNPKIIFLDEPTIGLDVVAKRTLRSVLRSLNREFGTTIFLTSHDAGDVEALCRRTIIINHGKVIYDDKTVNLKRQYIKEKLVSVRFEEKVENVDIENVEVLKSGGYGAMIKVDTTKVPIRSVLEDLVQKYSIVDINVEDPVLEEIIEKIYKEGA